jgi:mycothiol synthase
VQRPCLTSVAPADAAAVTELLVAFESHLMGQTAYSQADLEDEWSDLDLGQNAWVVRDGDRIIGYGVLHEHGELWRAEGFVHPEAFGRGIGTLIATSLEEDAARRGAGRVQNSILEADRAAAELLESLGYRAVRLFRELRVDLEAQPPAPAWPDPLRVDPFHPERDAIEFHAAHQDAFADHWEYTPRDFDSWSKTTLESERFDPALWCVVRSGDEIVAGTICSDDTYGGGWVHALFTRRRWRKQGVGTALLADAFRRFWERGQPSVGLGVDSASETGAFRLYERAGMKPVLGWVVYEKRLRQVSS